MEKEAVMIQAEQIRPHMQVVGNDGELIGAVDSIDSGELRLTKSGAPDGKHHFLPLETSNLSTTACISTAPAFAPWPSGAECGVSASQGKSRGVSAWTGRISCPPNELPPAVAARLDFGTGSRILHLRAQAGGCSRRQQPRGRKYG
jgi:hypothetical protein